jgi:hypothetical protein
MKTLYTIIASVVISLFAQHLLAQGGNVASSFYTQPVSPSLTVSTPVSLSNGGTNTGSQTANGVVFDNGTVLTSGTGLVFTGTNLGVGTSTPRSLFSVSAGLSATTTIDLGEKTCFNLGNATTTQISFYFNGTTLVSQYGRCL